MMRMSGVGVCQRGARRPAATMVFPRPIGVVDYDMKLQHRFFSMVHVV